MERGSRSFHRTTEFYRWNVGNVDVHEHRAKGLLGVASDVEVCQLLRQPMKTRSLLSMNLQSNWVERTHDYDKEGSQDSLIWVFSNVRWRETWITVVSWRCLFLQWYNKGNLNRASKNQEAPECIWHGLGKFYLSPRAPSVESGRKL